MKAFAHLCCWWIATQKDQDFVMRQQRDRFLAYPEWQQQTARDDLLLMQKMNLRKGRSTPDRFKDYGQWFPLHPAVFDHTWSALQMVEAFNMYFRGKRKFYTPTPPPYQRIAGWYNAWLLEPVDFDDLDIYRDWASRSKRVSSVGFRSQQGTR